MEAQATSALQYGLEADANINKRRHASWLLSDYTDQVWLIADTGDPTRTRRIDFDMMLADGRSLIEAPGLLATVKEYAWWLRDPRFSRIEAAVTHAGMVRKLKFIAHALTLRGIQSFAHIQPIDLAQLVEEFRFGADAVLHASERVEAYLGKLSRANEADPKPFGGLPRWEQFSSGDRMLAIHASQVMERCKLPLSASHLPNVAALLAQAAKVNGRRARDLKSKGNVSPPSNVTAPAMQRWLDPFEQIYAMRRRMEADTIGFKPFPYGATRVAAVKGIGVGRTPTPPPLLALHLLEHAALRVLEQNRQTSVGLMKPTDVVHMATACWVIIASFTARRAEEINDLRDGCVRGDDTTGWWLHVYIEKTLKHRDWIPVPVLVVRAVQILVAISASARHETGTDYLFQWLRPNGKAARFDVRKHLDDLAATVRVPLHRSRDGFSEAWHWHPHQFRRFFAVLYFYRFEGATIEALSHHLRHFSLEMTRRYITQDPEVAALWTDVEWGYTGHLARAIAAGERSVSGAAGERLKKASVRLVDAFRRKLQVASPDRVGASLALLMQRQGMVLTPKPWVTCSCPRTRDAAAKAACRHEGPPDDAAIGPDFVHAGPLVCSACPHAVIEGARTSVIEAEVDHLETAVVSRSRVGTLFGALEEARLIDLRQARDVRYRSASPVQRASVDGERTP